MRSSWRRFPAAATTTLPARYIVLVIARQGTPSDRRDDVGGADHRAPERVVAEHSLAHQVVDELVRRVLVHRDLLEHDLALGVELGEERRVDHVAHHVERLLEVVVGDAHVDDGVLARGRGVQLPAEPVEDLGDLLRGVERVPLKSRCSRKCVTPALEGVSSRDPAPIQKPSATERTLGMRSVITRWPESSSLNSYFCTGQA